jgi:hypothetical protein
MVGRGLFSLTEEPGVGEAARLGARAVGGDVDRLCHPRAAHSPCM